MSENFTLDYDRRRRDEHAKKAEEALNSVPAGAAYSEVHERRAVVATAHATLAIYYDGRLR